jgi:hypothetical protein
MGSMCDGHSNGSAEPIEILPGSNLFEVRFEFDGQLGISIILPATCALSAQLKAWNLFPERRRRALSTTVYAADYCEVDWETGRCFMAKRQKVETIPSFLIEEPENERGGEETE